MALKRTNMKGIDAAVAKAVARAEWYKANYRGAKDFQKRYVKQFHTVIGRFLKSHELTGDQIRYLHSQFPEQFRGVS